MTGRPNPMVGPSLSIAKDGPIPVTSRTTTRQVEPQIKAGGGHQTIRLAKPPIKVDGSKKIPTPRHLQHSTFHRSSSLGCATVLQSKPITAFSNDESHYHPKPTSHDKKKRSHASKPAHTQWHDKTKQKRQPKPKQDTTLKEREVHLSYADVSQEEWANQIKFALHHKSRVKAACELPEESRPQPLKVANEARLKEAILALTNLSPEIPSHKVKLATLLDSVDLAQARVAGLTTTRKGALLVSMALLPSPHSASCWKDSFVR